LLAGISSIIDAFGRVRYTDRHGHSYGTEIRDLAQDADRFQAVLQTARDKLDPEDWTWYPYDSLGLFSILDQMLTGRRYLLDLIGNRTVLDIGCGDGALALFFESLGYPVTAVDNSATNCNRMQGIRALRQALGSNIDIVDLDVDSARLSPPAEPYGIALALGILYHLRNPFHLLDEIAKHSRYCLVDASGQSYSGLVG
jgi:tRNA (mo5U34)-methyltransferase